MARRTQQLPVEAFRVADFCHMYGIGRSKAFEEIKDGKLKIIKVGALTLITKKAAQEWLKSYE